MITLGLTKTQALKLDALLPEEKWAAPLRAAIRRQIADEAPWRKVVSTRVSNLAGTGASNYREDTLECGHKWRSNYVRFPASPPDGAGRRRCKLCADGGRDANRV